MSKCSFLNLGHTGSETVTTVMCWNDCVFSPRLEASKKKPAPPPHANYLGATLSNKSRLGHSEKNDLWKLKLDQQYWNHCVWVWPRHCLNYHVRFHVCGWLVSNISFSVSEETIINWPFICIFGLEGKIFYILTVNWKHTATKKQLFAAHTSSIKASRCWWMQQTAAWHLTDATTNYLKFKFCSARLQNYCIMTCDLRGRRAEV